MEQGEGVSMSLRDKKREKGEGRRETEKERGDEQEEERKERNVVKALS